MTGPSGEMPAPTNSATLRLRDALLAGERFTRLEACEKFGITGSTFRWTIKRMRDSGIGLAYDEVSGKRNASTRRWRVDES